VDKKNDSESVGMKAVFTGASAANGALFGSILGPLGAVAGALVMGGITLAITSIKGEAPAAVPKRIPSQQKQTLSDSNALLSFRDKVSAVLQEIEHPKEKSWRWEDIANDAASVLPIEVYLTGSAVDVFLKWKLGYDASNSAGPGLHLLAAIGKGVIGHWGGAAASMAQAGIKAHEQDRAYRAFLDSDKYFSACATIMGVYQAEIFSTNLIILHRATAAEYSDLHGGRSRSFGGGITDRRPSH
jgi:hypothetical protein